MKHSAARNMKTLTLMKCPSGMKRTSHMQERNTSLHVAEGNASYRAKRDASCRGATLHKF
jgi:hypothetical protein